MCRQGRWGLPGEIEFLFSSLDRRLGPSLAACQKQAQERLTIGFVRARHAARAEEIRSPKNKCFLPQSPYQPSVRPACPL